MAKIGIKAEVIRIIGDCKLCSSEEVFEKFETKPEYATVKRVIGQLLSENLISAVGVGKATRYKLNNQAAE